MRFHCLYTKSDQPLKKYLNDRWLTLVFLNNQKAQQTEMLMYVAHVNVRTLKELQIWDTKILEKLLELCKL